MADIVKIIDSKQAFDDLTRLSTQLDGMQTQINNLSSAAAKMNVSLGGIKTPANLQKEIDAIAISQERVRVATLKREQAEIRLKDLNERMATASANRAAKEVTASAREEAALAKKSSTYYKLQAALTKLKKEYQDLAVKQNLGIAINAKEEARLTSLTSKITKLDSALKKTDAGMGVHTRSVGNYGKAFDSLGFSVAQMTRESPAFLISMNTGFMALSNNIPIFVDEVNRAAKASKELAAAQANGQRLNEKNASIWKKLGAAMFSWQSLISIGILLLTIYGGKMVEFFSDMIKGAKGIDIMKEAQKDVNEVKKEGIKQSGKELAQLKILSEAVKDVSKTEDERNNILQKIRDKYGDDIKHLTDREILTNGLAKAEGLLKDKIIERATADAAASKISENISKIIDLQIERVKVVDNAIAAQKRLTEAQKVQNTTFTQYGASIDNNAQSQRDFNSANEALIKNSKDLNLLFAKNNELMKFAVADLDVTTKKGSEKSKSSKKAAEEEQKYLFGSIGYLEEIIKLYNDLLKKTTDPKNRDFLLEQIKQTEDLKKSLLELNNGGNIVDILPKADSVNIAEFANNLSKEFKVSKMIFDDEFKKFLDNPDMDIDDFKDKMKSIAEAVEEMNKRMQESFNQFADTTNMFFDNRIEKLEQDRDANGEYYDNLIGLAENNEDEQARLEYAKEARDKELRQKQNEAAKKQAIFNKTLAIANVAMKLGETIMAHKLAAAELNAVSLGTLGTIYQAIEIPLSIALAAAQTAAIISAPVPKFKEGTKGKLGNDTLAYVGDGGVNEFLERDGKIFMTPKTDTLVGLKKGDEVHKDLDSLISSKGYDSNDIYKATVMASLASDRGISTMRLEKVLDNSLKDLDNKIVNGIQKGFRNVNFNSYPKIDMGHIKYKNDTL